MAFVFLTINNCICFALRNIIKAYKTKNINVIKYIILHNKDSEREQQWLITSLLALAAVIVIDFEYLHNYYNIQPAYIIIIIIIIAISVAITYFGLPMIVFYCAKYRVLHLYNIIIIWQFIINHNIINNLFQSWSGGLIFQVS